MSVNTLANGWCRFSVTYTTAAGASNFYVVITASDGNFAIASPESEKVIITDTHLNQGGKRIYTRTTSTIVP